MRVLHFIPHFADIAKSVGLQYKLALIKAMAESADVHLLCADHPDIEMGNVHIHKFSPLRNMFGGRHSSFDRFLSEIHPDIVHIHACWSIYAYYFLRRCEKYRIPAIITFDRQLESWHVFDRYWLKKFIKVLVYQRYIMSHANSFHSVCDNEVLSISDFIGFPSWVCKMLGLKSEIKETHHVDLGKINENQVESEYDIYSAKCGREYRHVINVEAFSHVCGKSADIMSDEMLSAYQVVLDSNPFMCMNNDDCIIEDILMTAGVDGNTKVLDSSDNNKSLFDSLTISSWRRILLHSMNEGILENVLSGVKYYNLSQPFLQEDICSLFCLPTAHPQIVTDSRRISKFKSDTSLSEVERNICVMIASILYALRNDRYIRRADVIDLYRCLKYNNYDEVLLYNKIRESGMMKDTARLFQIMKERYGLGEGFMFIEPLEDSGTSKLRKMFFKANIQ